jgi:phosphoglycolate phosphatase-like HAD superfamily hydrolase
VYDWILFDIDGVMLSEERYFDASSLAVYELLTNPRYLGLRVAGLPEFRVQHDDAAVTDIRTRVFDGDHYLRFIKERGVNANWDMVYLQFVACLTAIAVAGRDTASPGVTTRVEEVGRKTGVASAADAKRTKGAESPEGAESGDVVQSRAALIERLRRCVPTGTVGDDCFTAYRHLFAECRDKDAMLGVCERQLQRLIGGGARDVWELGKYVFQEWYLGDVHGEPAWFGESTGKPGYLEQERPIVAPQALGQLFDGLRQRGIGIGIATGRPRLETEVPLSHFGWLSRFEPERITTASEVLVAEERLPDLGPLSKPHPFSYLKSYLGESDPVRVLQTPLPLPAEAADRLLVVGDSVADALAAKALGCHFAAVLTGLDGQSARATFEKLGCTYIFDDVLGLWSIID